MVEQRVDKEKIVETKNRKHSELMALIALLDEPDELVFSSIRNRIMDFGITALPVLEKKLPVADDALIINRMGELIDELFFNESAKGLRRWGNTKEKDILKAWVLLSEFLYPELDKTNLNNSFMRIFKDVWLEINNRLTALEKIKVINHILYKVYSFSGSAENLFPDSYLLGNFLQYKQGTPLTMSMFYLSLAQRLRLPVFGVSLPHHFILAYVDEQHRVQQADRYTAEDVLFYINPFNKGVVFTKNEVDLYLKQYNITPKASYSSPCSNVRVIQRFVTELEQVWEKEGKHRKAALIKGFKNAL